MLRYSIGLCIVLMALGQQVYAGNTFRASVTKVLADGEAYGGCMAYLDKSPKDEGNGCANAISAVTFDCINSRGDTNKTLAALKFSNAQLALVTGAEIKVKVTAAGGLPNGVCFAEWVQVFPAP